jgi:hypothetical protein
MNFGFSGPIAEREVVDVKVRIGIEVFEHLHRAQEPNGLLGSDGGISNLTYAGLDAQFKMSKLKPFDAPRTSKTLARFLRVARVKPHLQPHQLFFDN